MLQDPVVILSLVTAAIVAIILVFGIATFARGGDFNRRNANRVMRWRLIAQFAAIVLVLGLVWLRSRG